MTTKRSRKPKSALKRVVRQQRMVTRPQPDFPWGTRCKIKDKPYWLNKCLVCDTSGTQTYHIIEGYPPRKRHDD